MKTELVRFLFPLAVLLVGGGAEEMLPKILSVGFPILMTAAILLSGTRSATAAVLLALCAGLAEDSLSGLPLATTASFLVLACLVARLLPAPPVVAVAAYPLYQFWLVVWTSLASGELWGRLMVSVPIAALTVFVLRAALSAWERRVVGAR